VLYGSKGVLCDAFLTPFNQNIVKGLARRQHGKIRQVETKQFALYCPRTKEEKRTA
jgi:hypothetical protein